MKDANKKQNTLQSLEELEGKLAKLKGNLQDLKKKAKSISKE